MAREWKRYEGTPQRDLFRELRERFLGRNASTGDWVLDVGAGPGRFSLRLGRSSARRVLLDLSVNMLREAGRRLTEGGPVGPSPDLVRGDATHPPFKPGRFSVVAMLGNVIGFAERDAGLTLDRCLELVGPGGTVVLETAPDVGERSRYLGRLPPGAVRRLLAAPINAIRPRLEREGFRREAPSPKDSEFARYGDSEISAHLTKHRFELVEGMAVAPALGADPERIAAVRPEPPAWRHLLELEEVLGRTLPRRNRASALLVAARRPPG